MTLIDTSSWIHQLRDRGDATVRRRVETLLQSGEALWCPIVRLELWAGVRGASERKVLAHYEQIIPELEITSEIWDEACKLASLSRQSGNNLPSSDLLIAACARHHGVGVESSDAHFAVLMKL